jgi:ribosomal protein S18 acetylase RimI-like enzyme
MSGYIIQSLQDKYLAATEELLKSHPEIFSQTNIQLCRKDLLEYLIQPRHVHDKVLLYIKDDIVYGMLIYRKIEASEDYFKIEWLAIKNGEEGKGYGSALLEDALEGMKKLGGKHLYVETSNEKYNEKAKHFYSSHGFRKMGILPNYYEPAKDKKRTEDEIIYYKII